MTPKKTTKKTETQSKFYIAKKVSDARKKLEGKAKEYNEKFVKKQLESGREFIKELKADPIKRIDDLIDDSKDTLKKAKEKRYNAWQKAVKTARTDAKKKFKKINDQGKEVYTGIGNDAKLIIENILEMGKKNLDKLPMKKTIEKKISSGIESIPSRLNLPSRDEIDNLVIGIDGVNKKVDELNKHFATA